MMKKFRPMHRSPGSIATWRKTSKFTIPLFFTSKYNILWRRQHFSSLTMAHVTTTIWASGRKSSNQRPKFRLRKFLSSLQWAFRPVVRIGSFYSKLKTSHRVSLFLTHSGFFMNNLSSSAAFLSISKLFQCNHQNVTENSLLHPSK